MYLRGEFKDILEHRGFPQLQSLWPTDNNIKKLVDAADGLFAHPAAVLRHVAYLPDSQFRERLQSVLDSLSSTRQRGSTSPFSQLDALYVHTCEADSREHSSVGTIASFLSFVLGYRQSFVCLHELLLVKDLRVYVWRHLSPSACRTCLRGIFRTSQALPFHHSDYPTATRALVDFLIIFRSVCCNHWQELIIASL